MPSTSASPRARLTADLCLIVVLVLGALAWPLHSPPIGLHGEAREALVVRDLVRTGSSILPHRNGKLPSKPPLYHWIAAAVASRVGMSDAVVRLPSALAAAVLVGTTFILGAAIGGRLSGWLAVGALLGTLPFWQWASEARVDMLFAATTTVALAAFFLWYRSRGGVAGGGQDARIVCYAAAACAVLVKGPAGLVLPGLVIVAFLLCERRPRVLWELWSWPLAALVLCVDLGWYLLAYRAGGQDFLATQVLQENVDRFLGRGEFRTSSHDRSVLKMGKTLVTHFFPWNLALVTTVLRSFRDESEAEAGRFLHVWWLTIFVFFTVSSGKRSVYLLPLAPAVAVLAACAIRRAYESWTGRRRLVVLAAVLALVDLGFWGGTAILHRYQARWWSLAPFAAQARERIPAGAPLYAGPALPEAELLVLSYRLDRLIERRRLGCSGTGAYFFVPKVATPRRALLSSNLARAPVSLVREDDGCPGGSAP